VAEVIERAIEGKTIRLLQGDITRIEADAIVNAANMHLAGGGGVDGVIHRVGGPEIMEDCRRIGGCPTGGAVATRAGRLKARHVIHAVAPRWQGGDRGEPESLASAYRTSLEVAEQEGDRTIAFPSLGTGIYGNPLEPSARIALRTVAEYLRGPTQIVDIVLILFSEGDLRVYAEALGEVLSE
jgi:O-acetyl-ADP-ribose deacetylase (regulator of RNase III)